MFSPVTTLHPLTPDIPFSAVHEHHQAYDVETDSAGFEGAVAGSDSELPNPVPPPPIAVDLPSSVRRRMSRTSMRPTLQDVSPSSSTIVLTPLQRLTCPRCHRIERRARCATQCASIKRNYGVELDYLKHYVVQQRCWRDKVLWDTQHICRHFFPPRGGTLAAELSTDDKEGRSWVRQQSKLFPMCVLKGNLCPVPDPTLS